MKRILLLAAFVAAIAVPAAANDPAVGAQAPDFTLKDSNGNIVHLSDAAGKFVVLEWINFKCPFVRKHYDSGNMQKLQREETAKGVVWYSICSSAPGKEGYLSADDWNKALKDNDWAGTALLIDAGGEVGHAYGAKTTPTMFVVDDKGVLVYKGGMDDKPTTDKDDVPSARNYVRAALNDAMSGQSVAEPVTQSYGCSIKY